MSLPSIARRGVRWGLLATGALAFLDALLARLGIRKPTDAPAASPEIRLAEA